MTPAGRSARTGAGDPSRTLALLWRADRPATRGPKQSLDVDRVVDEAIALAGDRGIDSITMRALAERTGVSTMSMYTYVPGKAELLDLMLDTCYLRMPRPRWRSRSWRRRVTAVAAANRALLAEQPWALRVASVSRPPLGPGLMAKYEHELAAFDGTGLSDKNIDAALTFVLGFVQSQARAADDARRTDVDTGQDDAAWWTANAPILERMMDPSAYPRASRIGTAAGAAQGGAYDPDTAWRFGLRRVLDGLSALIEPDGSPIRGRT